MIAASYWSLLGDDRSVLLVVVESCDRRCQGVGVVWGAGTVRIRSRCHWFHTRSGVCLRRRPIFPWNGRLLMLVTRFKRLVFIVLRPKKKTPEIPITEPKKLGSVGREKFFFWKFFLLVFCGPCKISKISNFF